MSRRQQFQQPPQQQGNRNPNRQQGGGGRFQHEQQDSRSQWERQQRGPTESFDAQGDRYGGGGQHGDGFERSGRQQDWQSRGQGHQSGQQDDWARSNQWDEDRYGYPEATSYGREMSRGESGYGGRGRFGQGDDNQGSGFRQQSGMAGSGSGSGFGSSSGSYGSGYGIPAGGDSRQQWGGGYSEQTRSRQEMSPGNQQRPGGKTPKGYVRSDDRIKDDICERLYHSHDMDVAAVTVNVSEGVVVLEGSVSERGQKHRIEDICEQCIGVKDVENRIRVSRGEEHESDARDGNEQHKGAVISAGERSRKGSTSTGSTGSNAH
jgi:hypothetical protein